MARPNSWLPRLDSIRAKVARSSVSHYQRNDIAALFDLKPRATALLMELLPTIVVGNSLLVPTDGLSAFLDRLKNAAEPGAFLAQLKRNSQKPTQRRNAAKKRPKLRTLSLHDLGGAAGPPRNLSIQAGEATIRFENGEDLLTAIVWFAAVLANENDLNRFLDLYCPEPLEDPSVTKARETALAEIAFYRDWSPQ
jgi:hypothetical protein